MWYKFGRLVTRFPWIVVLLVIGITIPCAMRAVDFRRTVSAQAFTPRHADATEAFEEMSIQFGPGQIIPYYLVVVPPANTTLERLSIVSNNEIDDMTVSWMWCDVMWYEVM